MSETSKQYKLSSAVITEAAADYISIFKQACPEFDHQQVSDL
jgi:hypothetical protein